MVSAVQMQMGERDPPPTPLWPMSPSRLAWLLLVPVPTHPAGEVPGEVGFCRTA